MSAAGKLAAVAVGAVLIAGATGGHGHHAYGKGHPHQAAVAFAFAQIGKPYEWGGAGPGAFDCSGLAMEAERAAGISIPRTSQEQWAAGHRVSRPKPGDLVFFVGQGDGGTMTAPGHVGIVVSARRHLMIDAASPGTNVREESYAGWPGFVGFTDPGA
jgi:cell wall-associated NlpC family hydrolase